MNSLFGSRRASTGAVAKLGTAVAVVACLWSPLVSAQEARKSLIFIQRTIDARYAEAPEKFEKLLSSSLTQPYKVEAGDNIQQIVSKKYSIGQFATPQLYEGVAKRIQELNSLDDVGHITAGARIKLPDIPPVQLKQADAANLKYGIPRVQEGPSYAAVLAGTETSRETEQAVRRILDAGRKAESLVNQWRWLTPDQARAERASLSAAEGVTIWAQPLTIQFAQVAPAPAGASSIAPDLNFLKSLVQKHAPQHDVVVFVLDDSWPSQAAFEDCRKFFVDGLVAIHKANYFDPPTLPIELVNGTGKTTFSANAKHAGLIASSLADFQKISPRVKVIYIPMFTAQKWAKELWTAITYTTFLAASMYNQIGVMSPDEQIKAHSSKTTGDLVSQIPDVVVKSVGPAEQTPVTSLHKFAQLYARLTNTPYFVSMSWTIKAQEIPFGPDPKVLGVSLAASGNDSKKVLDDEIYLAYRAKAAPGDVLAVMNTDATGQALCGSNTLPLSGSPFYGLAYDGTFRGAEDECGSSFSTPRVAWLLALREAYNPPVPQQAWGAWYEQFRTGVTQLQTNQSTSMRYWLRVPKLFEGL